MQTDTVKTVIQIVQTESNSKLSEYSDAIIIAAAFFVQIVLIALVFYFYIKASSNKQKIKDKEHEEYLKKENQEYLTKELQRRDANLIQQFEIIIKKNEKK